MPEIFEIEIVQGDGSAEEIYHIAQFKAIGCDLTNMTDGGEGFLGHRHTSEHRAKIAASLRGQKRSPETRARMSAAMKGKPKSEAHKLALSHKVVSAETRAKFSAVHKGKVMSAESRAKMSASRTGTKRSPETCANISAGRKRAAQRAALLALPMRINLANTRGLSRASACGCCSWTARTRPKCRGRQASP